MSNSGRTSEVRVTVPDTEVNCPMVSVRRFRMGRRVGRLCMAIKYLFLELPLPLPFPLPFPSALLVLVLLLLLVSPSLSSGCKSYTNI